MRILIATDAWKPQVNGVVRTYEQLAEHLMSLGAEPAFITPAEFRTVPCPTYPEIRLALPGYGYLKNRLDALRPDAVHIATEGPVGLMTRIFCQQRGIPFTTSFHTRFPEYVHSRLAIPTGWTYALQRWFHNGGKGVMVSTPSLARELESRGFERVLPWTRGVDTALFRPLDDRLFGSDQPVMLYVGRVAVEKNIDAFLQLDVPGTKVVVGAGPMLDAYRQAYPDVVFTGMKSGEELARCYASADVFVFPSRTDTFGIVLLEAMASGLPIAALPVTGPIDVVRQGETGYLDDDLGAAVHKALSLDRRVIRERALDYGWDSAARLFIANIETALFAHQGRRIPSRGLTIRRRPNSA